jgi:hypothetical protein
LAIKLDLSQMHRHGISWIYKKHPANAMINIEPVPASQGAAKRFPTSAT